MYLRIINDTINYPYTIEELRIAHPTVSFPAEMDITTLNEWGVWGVLQTPMPVNHTKNITEGTPVLIDGFYNQYWNQSDASIEEINSRLESKWIEIRELRDSLLAECDWTQLSDSPQNTNIDWKTYRQSLRDITSQENPFNITWPAKP